MYEPYMSIKVVHETFLLSVVGVGEAIDDES